MRFRGIHYDSFVSSMDPNHRYAQMRGAIRRCQARDNLNSTTSDAVPWITQEISPKCSKHISEMDLVRYGRDLTPNNRSCRSNLHPPRCPRSGRFPRNYYSRSSSFTYRAMTMSPKPCSSFAVIGTTPHFIFPLCGLISAFRMTHPCNSKRLSSLSRRDAIARTQPPFTSTLRYTSQ